MENVRLDVEDEENSSNISSKNPYLDYLPNYQTLVQKDYHLSNNKTAIVGVGLMSNRSLFVGFVGSGMLSATVLEDLNLLSSQKILEILKTISGLEKNGKPKTDILLFLQEWKGFNLARYLRAIYLADQYKISIKVILVENSDEINSQSHLMRSSDLSVHSFHPCCLPYLYKISGAMADDGKTLQEIYDTCNEIIVKDVIFGMLTSISQKEANSKSIEITFHRGNIHKCLSYHEDFILEKIVSEMCEKFLVPDLFEQNLDSKKLALVLSCSKDFDVCETEVITNKLVEHVNRLKISVEFVLYHALPHWEKCSGFNVICWNLSDNPFFVNYLRKPTSAHFWVNASSEVMNQSLKSESYNFKDQIEVEVTLATVDFACEALIACASNIDKLDLMEGETNKCGTRLATIAKAIQKSIKEKSFEPADSAVIIDEIVRTFAASVTPQDQLYAKFFRGMSNNLLKYKDHSKIKKWVKSFSEAVEQLPFKEIHEFEFFRVLIMAREKFLELDTNPEANLMIVLEGAVEAIQSRTANVDVKIGGYLGLADSHAIGIWMRGALEGFKQQYAQYTFRVSQKRTHDHSDDQPTGQEKVIKLD
ncbi:hypothetical protein TKK_0006951 [Trichogramma kaykai]|uniref:DhaK domain-containing protein n=1 Tax=Trichogramma kaykai TaxID=54128 RepID=A0ABD2XBZ6_9HYME